MRTCTRWLWSFGAILWTAALLGAEPLGPAPQSPPSNDECATAVVMDIGGIWDADTRFATPVTATAPGSSCQALQSRDVWFRWTAGGSGLVILDTCTTIFAQPSSDSVITAYVGTCGALTEVACSDNATCNGGPVASRVAFQATCGTTYTFRVSEVGTGVPNGVWMLNFFPPAFSDADLDGVPDCTDNCPQHANSGQVDCDGDGAGDVCELALGTSFDLDGNGVPDQCEAQHGVAFCSGDGTGAPCPCGNSGASGAGCVNSTGRGALLYDAGGTSVALDDAAPLAIHLPANKPVLFLLGANQQNGGNGVPFYDGKLCITVQKRLLAQTSAPAGWAVANGPVALAGGLIGPGSTWHFQAWFRDSFASPCGTGANLSNGLSIAFTP